MFQVFLSLLGSSSPSAMLIQ